VSVTGIGLRAATDSNAAGRPRSVSTGGPVPRIKSRSSGQGQDDPVVGLADELAGLFRVSSSNASPAGPRSAERRRTAPGLLVYGKPPRPDDRAP
jgi:hypothetical protein